MNTTHFLSFINSQMAAGTYPTWDQPNLVRRAVTISRQAGCGARAIADQLATLLQARDPKFPVPWQVFDRELMDQVLTDHRLPKNLSFYFPEDRKPAMEDILEDLFGLHPPQETIVRQTAETMLGLAETGNVILIGRAGNIITAKLPHVLHVRLIAPVEDRIEHACESYHLSPAAARSFCLREDLGRSRYVHKYFHTEINDPLAYHLVINTSRLSYHAAATLMADALLSLP